ncbi:MAG TPA: hypothetical protein VGV16_07475 [Gammaproteobacteria bacterium]|nr:hypothetical protein [Gammaproteobacteria bacterium]
MKRLTATLMGSLAAVALSTAFAAPDGPAEINTALAHARMAAAGTDLKTVDMHLHHVVNCLVGAKGTGYDASAGNPCQGMGDGALSDTTDKALRGKLQTALDAANHALADTNFDSAKKTAASVVESLKTGVKPQ